MLGWTGESLVPTQEINNNKSERIDGDCFVGFLDEHSGVFGPFVDYDFHDNAAAHTGAVYNVQVFVAPRPDDPNDFTITLGAHGWYHDYRDVEGVAHVVTLDDIAANDHNLNIPRYVEPKNTQETLTMDEAMKCLRESAAVAFAVEEKLIAILKREGLLI